MPIDYMPVRNADHLFRISVTGAKLYAGDDGVTFLVDGIRFRKDGSLGKIRDTFSLRFEGDQRNATK
jgi:hypothetical protein